MTVGDLHPEPGQGWHQGRLEQGGGGTQAQREGPDGGEQLARGQRGWPLGGARARRYPQGRRAGEEGDLPLLQPEAPAMNEAR